MKCEEFITWLENRDIHDVSEADKAHRHAAQCDQCKRLLGCEEALDICIAKALARENAPASLVNKVDLSIERVEPRRARRTTWAALAALCVVLMALLPFQGWIPGKHGEQPVLSVEQLGDYIMADFRKHGQGGYEFDTVTDAAGWLKEHLHTSEIVPERIVAGYTVRSARFCHLGDCLAVHMIYERDGKLLSLFVVAKENIDAGFENGRLYTVPANDMDILLSANGNYLYAAVSN